jgi:hypothetical protein
MVAVPSCDSPCTAGGSGRPSSGVSPDGICPTLVVPGVTGFGGAGVGFTVDGV